MLHYCVANNSEIALSKESLVAWPREKMSNSTLVIYHYFESSPQRAENLLFFLDHGVSQNVDYIFIISGECSCVIPSLSNIRVAYVGNSGSDFIDYVDLIGMISSGDHSAFIFVNCTMLGPFYLRDLTPWEQIFTSRLDSDTKLTGVSLNLLPPAGYHSGAYEARYKSKPPFPHVQTMLFALQRDTLEFLIESGFFTVPDRHISRDDLIVDFELRLSTLVLEAGGAIDCILPGYDKVYLNNTIIDPNPSANLGDPWFPGAYFNRSIHPYESVFFKINRNIREPDEIKSLMQTQYIRSKKAKF